MRALFSGLAMALAALASAGPASAQWAAPPASYSFEAPSACPMAWKRYDACADQMIKFTDALAKAREGKRKLLVVFGADWCPWCRTIDGNLPTFSWSTSAAGSFAEPAASHTSFRCQAAAQNLPLAIKLSVDGCEQQVTQTVSCR